MALLDRERDFSHQITEDIRYRLRGSYAPCSAFRSFLAEHCDAFDCLRDYSKDLIDMDDYMSDIRDITCRVAPAALDTIETDIASVDAAFSEQCSKITNRLRQYRVYTEQLTELLGSPDAVDILQEVPMWPPGKGAAVTNAWSPISNYDHNKKQNQLGPGMYINGQGSYGHFKYGAYESDYNGCGWIAIYNALIAMGLYVPPADIIYWLETNNGLIAKGLFGTKMLAIKAFLQGQGLSVQSKGNDSNLDETIKNVGAFVLEYAFAVGVHFVTIRYNQADNLYYIYNENNSISHAQPESSIEQWMKNDNHLFIAGLIIT